MSSTMEEGGMAGAGAGAAIATPAPAAPKLETLAEDRIAKLANVPNTTVYKYTHDVAEVTMTPLEQKECLRELCSQFDALCRRDKVASKEKLRQDVLRNSPTLRQFQKAYPALFAKCTERASNDRLREELTKYRKTAMAYIMTKVDGDAKALPFKEQEARAMTLSARLAMRERRPEDVAAQEQGLLAQLAPDNPAAAVLTPLDFDSFGGTVVHQ